MLQNSKYNMVWYIKSVNGKVVWNVIYGIGPEITSQVVICSLQRNVRVLTWGVVYP